MSGKAGNDKDHYDLSEKASERPGEPGATEVARKESALTDLNREMNQGISDPEGDTRASNSVATSLDDE